MIRHFLFFGIVPLLFTSIMIASGQWQASSFGLEVTPPSWPSSRPSYMQTTAPPQPDLSVSKSDSSDPARVGMPLTYTITVANNSTEEATGVTLYDILPSSVNFGSATPSQGNCSGSSIMICDLNSLNSGATVTVTVVVTPAEAARITNAAGVSSGGDDPDLTNNTTVEETQVTPSGSLIYLPLIFK